MARRLIFVLCIALSLPAADRWVQFRYGPFEVLTDAGAREGRQALNDLEQLRYTLGGLLGKQDLQSVWPIRVLVFRSPKDFADRSLPAGLALGRDALMGAAEARKPLPAPLVRECARILMASNYGPLPKGLESGIATLFSTLDVTGTKVILGPPPAPVERDANWAQAHMLAVSPDYYGKMKVLAHNLEQGVEEEPAYRNAFGKTPAAIGKEADAYLRAGAFSTVPLSGHPISAEKEFAEETPAPGAVQVAQADLYLANPARASRARSAFNDIANSAEAPLQGREGLGLLALRVGEKDDARKLLAPAIEAGSASALAYFEYARLEPDPKKAAGALEKAARLNPRWAAPQFELGLRESDPQKKAQLLAAAARVEPRNGAYWQALAEAYTSLNQLADAAKAWAEAERAAPTDAERTRLRGIHAAADKARLDKEEADRRQRAEQERLAVEKLKHQAEASIQAALDKANRDSAPRKPGEKVYDWWEDPKAPASVEGTLQRVECPGARLVLVVQAPDRRLVRLLVQDPRNLAVRGAGDFNFACGPQRTPRKIRVEYFPKADAALKSAGEAAVIEFPK